MQLAKCWRCPALKRDNLRRSRRWRHSPGTSYRPRSIRDESALLSMDDQAVMDIWVVEGTERSVRRDRQEATVMVECGSWTFLDICPSGHSASVIAQEGGRAPAN
jgi:hypothetical protein